MATNVEQPFQNFIGLDGRPLSSGQVYIGVVNTDPVTNPIAVFWDDALTIPATQPLQTNGGYIVRNGTPARVYAADYYSMTVRTNNGVQVYYVPDSSSFAPSFDGSRVVITPPSSVVGAVKRTLQSKLYEQLTLEDFLPSGHVTDGSVDYTSYVQTALNSIKAGVIKFNTTVWCASSITVPDQVSIEGTLGSVGSSRYSQFDFTTVKGALYLSDAASINLGAGSTVSKLLILNKNLIGKYPFANATAASNAVAAYAGTAIKGMEKEDVYLHNLRILGFAQAISVTLCDRHRVDWIDIDCTAGYLSDSSFDIPRIYNVHCWPFLTYGYSFAGDDPVWRRAGSGFKTTTHFDAGVMTNCFAFGYQIAFDIQAPVETQLIGCYADNRGDKTDAGQIGFKFTGSTLAQISMTNCGSSAQDIGIVVNGAALTINVDSCHLWGNRIGVQVLSAVYASIANCQFYYLNSSWSPDYQLNLNGVGGVADISNNLFYGANLYKAIFVDNYNNSLKIHGNTFEANTTGITYGATVTGETAIIGNSFPSTTTPYNIPAGIGTNRLTMLNNTAMVSDPLGDVRLNAGGQPAYSDVAYGGANGPRRYRYYARGTPAAPTIVTGSNTLGSDRFYGYDGAAFQPAGLTRFSTDGTPAANSMPGIFIVSTTPSATVAPLDRNATDSAGNFKPLTDNAYQLGVSGLRWASLWCANGTIQTSDKRTKTDISDAALGLDFINALRPVSYKWVDGKTEVVRQAYTDAEGNEIPEGEEIPSNATPGRIITKTTPGERTHWGLIAQEVKAAAEAAGVDFGGWVLSDTEDPESQQALRYDQFISPLIKAVQELSARVAELEGK